MDTKTPERNILVTHNGVTSMFSIEAVTNHFICEGSSAEELSKHFKVPVSTIENIIQENNLVELRAAHVKHGLEKIKSTQLVQAEKMLNIETQFKRMRIAQLEKTLEDFLAYFSLHGHFYKVHPVTKEILKDTNGIPLQIKLPNVTAEIAQLKESVSLSEGLTMLLGQIDAIINRPKQAKRVDGDTIDVTDYNNLFKKKQLDED